MTERAAIIGGQRAADALVAELAREIESLVRSGHVAPGLALVAIDDDPAQRLYVRKKLVQCQRAGVRAFHCPVAGSADTGQVLGIVRRLNDDPQVHGIFVQWPMPAAVDLDAVALAIAAAKDVDGMAHPNFAPAAAQASFRLLRETGRPLAGLAAVVACESLVFGKAMARLLLDAGCTVTLAPRDNKELQANCRRADVIVTALGEAQRIRGGWLKPGVTIVDAGVNVLTTSDGVPRYVGDVEFESAVRVASAITPVPGGVGPLTIACLLQNTLTASKHKVMHGRQ